MPGPRNQRRSGPKVAALTATASIAAASAIVLTTGNLGGSPAAAAEPATPTVQVQQQADSGDGLTAQQLAQLFAAQQAQQQAQQVPSPQFILTPRQPVTRSRGS